MKYSLTGSQITRGPTMPAVTVDRWQREDKHTVNLFLHLQSDVIFSFSNLIGPEFGKNNTTTINKIRHNYFTITLKNFEGGRPPQ